MMDGRPLEEAVTVNGQGDILVIKFKCCLDPV